MKIAVRMDDITPEMDWEKFERFRALLETYKIKPLIGVVPDNRDENLNRTGRQADGDGTNYLNRTGRQADGDGANYLNRTGQQADGGDDTNDRSRAEQQADGGDDTNDRSRAEQQPEDGAYWNRIRELQESGWVIAQHGYQHRYTQKKGGMFPLNHFSEFAGLSYEKQKEMIAAGRKILETHGIATDIFMAPAHAYDKNTLRALKANGFMKITDGFGKAPYRMRGMIFYPISFRLQNSLKRKDGVTTMVIHANTMKDADFVRCEAIFQKERMISYEELLRMEPVKRGSFLRAAEYAAACVKHLLVKLLA